MSLAKDIINEMNEGMKLYGEYTFHDKGAEEVMDIFSIVKRLKHIGPSEAINTLKQVESNVTNEDERYTLLTGVMAKLDTWDAFWDIDTNFCESYY